jgi:hypothetical protein
MLSVLQFDAPIHARCTLPTACKCRSTLLFKLVTAAAAVGRNWHMSLSAVQTAGTQSTEQEPRVPNTTWGRRTEHVTFSAISSSEIHDNHLLASGCYRLYPRGKQPRHQLALVSGPLWRREKSKRPHGEPNFGRCDCTVSWHLTLYSCRRLWPHTLS